MTRERLNTLGLIILIAITSFFLRVYRLGPNSSFNADEVTTVTRSMHGVADIWHLANKTPLQALWIRLGAVFLGLGYSEFSVYLMSVIAGVLAIVVVYHLGKLMFDRYVGLLSAFMLAFSAYHIYWSRSARYYALMVLLSSLAFLFLYRAIDTNELKAWFGYALFRTLSLYDHLTALWILAGEGIFVILYLSLPILKGIWNHRRSVLNPNNLPRIWHKYKTRIRQFNFSQWLATSKLLRFTIFMLLIIVAYAPLWFPLAQSIYLGSSPIRLGSVSAEQMTPEAPRFSQPRAVLGGGWQGPFLVLYLLDAWNTPLHIVMMIAFVSGLLFSVLRRQWMQLLFTLIIMVTPFILAANTASYRIVLNGRYLISLLPLYYIMAGQGITGIGHWFARITGVRGNLVKQVVLAVLILFVYVYAGLSFAKIPLAFQNTGQNLRAVGQFLEKNAKPDQLIVVHGIPTLPKALKYYLPDFNVVKRDPQVTYNTLYEEEDGFWLVFQPGIDMYTWIRDWIDEHKAVSLIFSGGWFPDIDKYNPLAPAQNEDLYVAFVSSSNPTAKEAIEMHLVWLRQTELLNPGDVRLHLTLAEAYRRNDLCEWAVMEYTNALNEGYVNDQLASYIYDARGRCWHRKGSTEQAIADWQQAIAHANWSEKPYQHLGNAYQEIGNTEAALALFQQGIADNPMKAWPHVLLGDYYNRHGKDEQTISEYNRAIEIEPHDRRAYQRMGGRYAAAGELTRVVSLYEQAIKSNPWSGWTHFQLGQFYYRMGKVAEAIDEYDKAVEINPEYTPSVSNKMDNAKWDLAAVLNLVHVYSDTGELLWWPGNSWVKPYPFDPEIMVGYSTLEVGGSVRPNQLFLHPFNQEENTYIEFEIPDNPFTNLKVGFGLADKAAKLGNGVQYQIQVRRETDDTYQTLHDLVVTENLWEERSVSLAPYWGEDLQFRLVVGARGDYDFDWLQTNFQLSQPPYPVWDLAAHLKEVKLIPSELPLEMRSDGFYLSNGNRLIGQSKLLVEGRSVPGQVMLHPYSSEYESTLYFTLPHQQFRSLKTSFGLADEVVLISDGVDYTVSVSTDGGGTFTDLISTTVTSNTWSSYLVDVPPSKDLVLRLSAAARQNATFDWLQVNLVLLPIHDS